MHIITSRSHPDIIRIHKLKQKKERVLQGLFIAEGERTIKTLLNSSIICVQIYTTDHMLACAQNLIHQRMITRVSDHVMEKISTSTTPSGLLGIFKIPQDPDLTLISPGIVLAQLNDPGNVGTLIRTAVALQLKTVILINSVDPWNPKVVQASAGTIGLVHIFILSWETLLTAKKSLYLAALTVKDGQNPQEITQQDVLLVIGNEAHGIPHAWIDTCEISLTLPMPGGIESLNAAIAGSLVMYQVFAP